MSPIVRMMSYGSSRFVSYSYAAGATTESAKSRTSSRRRAWNAGSSKPAGVSSVGVTSGASVPDDLVQGVLELLVEQGYPAAREERLTEESLTFALPPELRRGLKRKVQGD